MSKHSRPSTVNYGQRSLVALVALVVLVVAGLGAWWLLGGRGDDGTADGTGDPQPTAADPAPDDEDRTTAPTQEPTAAPPTCGSVTVWAAPSVLPAVEEAASRAGDDCLEYDVVERGSSVAQSELRGGTAPDVWVPDSHAWPALMAQEGVELEVGPTIASSPVVLAGDPSLVEGLGDLGVDEGTTWGELMERYEEFVAAGPAAPVSLRVGDPRTDPASMALLGTTSGEFAGWDAEEEAGRRLLVNLAQSAVQGDPLSAVRSDPRTLVPATEQQLGLAADEGADLEGVSLSDGSGVVRIPFVRVGDLGDGADAAQALEEELTGERAAGDLEAVHLRPGEDGDAPGVAGVPDDLATDATDPDQDEIVALAEAWTVIAPQSRILALIDISGSMAADAGGQTRIDLAREAMQTALTVVPEQTAVGLWYFATSLDGLADHVEAVPIRALGDEADGGVSQREALLAQTEELTVDRLMGDTGLNDSLWIAYEQMRATDDAESISSVLLLTDGINDDSTGGLTDDEVVALLTQARETEERPVAVVLIGMGPDVDEDALERLATAAGGESLVLRDPRELPQVFADVVARRAAG